MSEKPNANESVDSNVLINKIAEKLSPVTRLVPEPLSFSDLPNEILGKIVEKLDLVSRLKTRKVSRRLRSIVDQQKAYYEAIFIRTCKNHRVDIGFDEVMIHYSKSGCLIDYKNYGESIKHKFIEGDNFLEIALNDLAIALKKPKFQLAGLGFSFDIDASAENSNILNFFKSLKSPIHLSDFFIQTFGNYDILQMFSLLKPGTLEEIQFFCVDSNLNVNELVKMDQWKQAKRVQIGEIRDRPIPVDIEDFIHFERFASYVDSLSTKDVLRLRNVFSKSASFGGCDLKFRRTPVNLAEIGIALGAPVVQTPSGPTIVHRHPIPKSKEFLEFKINREGLTIARNL